MAHLPGGSCSCHQVVDVFANHVKKLFQLFIEEWRAGDEAKYLNRALELTRPERNTMTVSMQDVESYDKKLAQAIYNEYSRVYPYLCAAVKNVIESKFEVPTTKEYFIAFNDISAQLKVRDLTSDRIGKLLRFTGQVVRTYPVHPELWTATFMCIRCSTFVPDLEQQFIYTEPSKCPNPLCGNRSQFALDVSKSVFVDFQKIIIQEALSELPRGSIPRSLQVVLRSDLVESVQSGDRCDFFGTLIAIPDLRFKPGFARQGSEDKLDLYGPLDRPKMFRVRDLCFRLSFWACSVQLSKQVYVHDYIQSYHLSPGEIKNLMSPSEWNTIYEMSNDEALLQHLTSSLFPTIYGNEEIKRGLLLMLFGGVGKTTEDMGTLRGDLNICIVGDPSTAKSQFLKHVAEFCPRVIYTSGKSSTAAGLTAAVVREAESSEFVIEAGALILCDNGVCCIDEFDKMDQRDKVAMHEAMEQQTITITKAGINATLNARTSILAAANPVSGCYDKTKSLMQNIQLSEALVSRFDLFFVLSNEYSEACDFAIACKIVNLHSKQEDSIKREYEIDDIRRYVNFAKLFKPRLTCESALHLINLYKKLRKKDADGAIQSSRKVTVRQLESLIRLSEALARVNCCDRISIQHVEEGYRLLSKSIVEIEQPQVLLDDCTLSGVEDKKVLVDQKHPRLAFEDYRCIVNMIVNHLREKKSEEIRKSQVVCWYIEEIISKSRTISQEEILEKKQIVEKVIDRLINLDNILVPIFKPGKQSGDAGRVDDPLLIVHPNYVEDK